MNFPLFIARRYLFSKKSTHAINVISLIVDAPQDVISALSGKLGMLPEVSTKTIYPPMPQ